MEKEHLKIVKHGLTALTVVVGVLWMVLTSIDYLAEAPEFSMITYMDLLLFNPYLYGFLALMTCHSIVSVIHENFDNPNKARVILEGLLGAVGALFIGIIIFYIIFPYVANVFELGGFDFLILLSLIFINPYMLVALILFGAYGFMHFTSGGTKLSLGRTPPVMTDAPSVPAEVQQYLIPHETIRKQFSPIVYNLLAYNCLITNYRILLYTADKAKFTEIDHRTISTLTLETEKRNDYIAGAILLIFLGSLLVFFYFIRSFLDIDLDSFLVYGILLFLASVPFIYLYLTQAKYFLQLHVGSETFQLYSTHDLLTNLINEVRTLKYSRETPVEGPPIPVPSAPAPIMSATKYCIFCGAEIRAVAQFCDKCGKSQES